MVSTRNSDYSKLEGEAADQIAIGDESVAWKRTITDLTSSSQSRSPLNLALSPSKDPEVHSNSNLRALGRGI